VSHAPDARGDGRLREAQLPWMSGQAGLVAAGLSIGILLLGVQLWLLTVALELFLSGHGSQVWSLALVSGLIFAGGLLILWLLGRRPRVGYP
jgi:hypothetical protein